MQTYYFYVDAATDGIFVSTQAQPQQKLAFIWVESTLLDVQQPELWRQQVEACTALQINEYHVEDVCNIDHPSSYDTTEEYDLLLFRKLVTPEDGFSFEPVHKGEQSVKMFNPAEILSTPISFFISKNALITVRDQRNLAMRQFIERLNSLVNKESGQHGKILRLPSSPLDLALRLLNVVIDRYLDIRLPLTQRINYWQHELLQSASHFTQWNDLFQENMALQHIEYLCEEQLDVLQELCDDIMENQAQLAGEFFLERQDITLVRVNDLLSHVRRVQHHVTRLGSMLKSAMDLHFSAIANQTNENMRILAIITAIFSPLTLLTGVYGMNFKIIPGLNNPFGFWLMLLVMVVTTASLMYFFRRKRLMGTGQRSITELLSQAAQSDFDKA